MRTVLVRARDRRLLALGGAILALVGVMVVPAGAAPAPNGGACARQFDEAQRQDMESFRDYDKEAFRAVHHDDAVTVFTTGDIVKGADEIIAVLRRHFEERSAIWSWTELHRVVDGCRTGFILYDTVYSRPSDGLTVHAVTGVTYTRQDGRWLALADQGTPLP